MSVISKKTLSFLKDLKSHNDRGWFNDQKVRYTSAHENMIEFASALIREMGKHDELVPMTGKQSLFRIYRDVRFSKDKSPYKTAFAGRMKRASKMRRGGYYYHIEPGNTVIAGGFWGPDSKDIKRIREEIAVDSTPLRNIITDKNFKKYFGELSGKQLKSAPQGYSKSHPDIDLLRYQQFLLVRTIEDDNLVTSDFFLKEMTNTYLQMRPFFDYMSLILTTDANGEVVV